MLFRILKWVFHQKWLTRYRYVHDKLMAGFAKLADRGQADAQELYGFLLLHKGSGPQSKSAGARYLLMCVSLERPKVCWQLYQLYKTGDVLAADEQQAAKYLAMAKQAEHPLTQDL